MASAKQFLADLSERRKKWVKASSENDFKKGILNLMTRLYPDQAHFIFELLQNAEDAKATRVKFDLCKQMLRFEHDGLREFTEKDVESITSIGDSSKFEDSTQIGEFGVGFKSVFAYTNTPRVMSGQFAFEITDLVWPHPLVDRVASSNQTCFEFPFNSESKTQDVAFREVYEGLKTLDSRTLLFLKQIRRISWSIEGDSEGSLERSQFDGEDDRLVQIQRKVDSAAPEDSLWLRFWRDSSVKKELGVSIAYRLEKLDKRKRIDSSVRLSDQCRIIPVDGGLSIWFPAVKETTKLKFQVHGPFAATVARDSIVTKAEDNQALLADCAQLLVSSLEEIKDLGLLTTRFLQVLPNSEDDLADFYQPILDEVLKAVRSRPLLPIEAGGHAPASEIVLGQPKIQSVIDGDALRFMTSAQDPDIPTRVWAAGKRGRRARAFLRDADVSTWGWEDLTLCMNRVFNREHGESDEPEKWIANRSGDWLQEFYALLWDCYEQVREASAGYNSWRYGSPSLWVILRLSDGSHVRGSSSGRASTPGLFIDDTVYFPAAGAIASEVRTLSPSVLPSEDSPLANKVRDFLVLAEVSELGETQRLHSLLKTFYYQETCDENDVPWQLTYINLRAWLKARFVRDHTGRLSQLKADKIILGHAKALEEDYGVEWVATMDEDSEEAPISIPSFEEHCEHLRSFVALWRETGETDLFEGYLLFHGQGQASHKYMPANLCLDQPFKETGLGHIYSTLDLDNPRVPLAEDYQGLGIKDLVPFATALGMVDSLEIKPSLAKSNPRYHPNLYGFGRSTHTGTNTDWNTDFLDELLALEDAGVSETIWRTVQAADAKVLTAAFRRNQTEKLKKGPSTLVIKLEEASWVPDKDGKFYSPAELTKQQLPENFPFDNRNGWLDAIGFGRIAEEELAEQSGRAEQLVSAGTELGISPTQAKKFKDLVEGIPEEKRGKIVDEFLESAADQVRDVAALSFPKRESPDPDRRKSKVQERAREAPTKEYVFKERSVRDTGRSQREDGKVYLRHQYTSSANGKMMCQICEEVMPFKLKDGSYYFEAVQAVSLEREHRENLLALCPVCAAMYKHANEMGEMDMFWEIIDHDDPIVGVRLAGESYEVHFTQQHYDDLKTVLEEAAEETESDT